MSTSNTESERVSFLLDDGSYENLHARNLGSNSFLIDNSPFYAYGISYLDVVNCKISSGKVVFDSVIRRGGHSTYRVKLSPRRSHKQFLELFKSMDELGCTFEGTGINGRRLYSIDVPPATDIDKVYRILEFGEDRGDWEFEEAHFFKGHQV